MFLVELLQQVVYIVGILGNNGISMVLGVFLTQIVTDLLDKILIVYLVLAAIKSDSKRYKK